MPKIKSGVNSLFLTTPMYGLKNVKANIKCAPIVVTMLIITHVIFLPVLSMRMPKNGLRAADSR